MHTYLIHNMRTFLLHNFFRILFLLFFSLSCSESPQTIIKAEGQDSSTFFKELCASKKSPSIRKRNNFSSSKSTKKNDSPSEENDSSSVEEYCSPKNKRFHRRKKHTFVNDRLNQQSKKIQKYPATKKSQENEPYNKEIPLFEDVKQESAFEKSIMDTPFNKLFGSNSTQKRTSQTHLACNKNSIKSKYIINIKAEDDEEASNTTEHLNNGLKLYSCRTTSPACLCKYIGYQAPKTWNKIPSCGCYINLLLKKDTSNSLAKEALYEYENYIKEKTTYESPEYMKLLAIIRTLSIGMIAKITDNKIRNDSIKNNKELVESISKLSAMLYMTTTSRTYEKFLTEDCFKELFLKIMKNNSLEKTLHIENIENFLINISTSGQEQRFTYEINSTIFPQANNNENSLASNLLTLSKEYFSFFLFWSDIVKITFLHYWDKYIVIIDKKNLEEQSIKKSYFYTTLALNSHMESYFESPGINFCILEDSSKLDQLQELKIFLTKKKNLFVITKINEKWILMCHYMPQKIK